ncbi:aldolase catalytic domain-containing protein [Marinobacter nauticus]|uniref:aldolase catalytic domain-containing protein n=1 Tax=Marinobacter nauticus TaxID=2743 RepID=UPI001A90451D|nr:aldolase catalytic domain-containing protein [Marinobacter nauticus]MBN8240471.1 aldolase catalytic domain-containing protein [Marinobacter nauticus]MBY6222509.1 aldolase catalytic domain-containing protein [Marinobacter nauticus]
MTVIKLDCTLRDGGYYNSWNFGADLAQRYLDAMDAAGIDVVEIGLRSLKNEGFKGAFAFSRDEYLAGLNLPEGLDIGVMVNASELVGENLEARLQALFPQQASVSPVSLVRVACHVHEFAEALQATPWLKARGYRVGFNLMQVADRSQEEIRNLAREAENWQPDVLYFADSMGGMTPEQTGTIIDWIRQEWTGPLGIHTHDNLGRALQNTLAALDKGVSWVDSTVTGMGRGPGNARTEELIIELSERTGRPCNLIPLMSLIRTDFRPMQQQFGWGTNPYYFLAGKYGIHPSFIQEMLADSRYVEEDLLAVIEHLRHEGGKKFSRDALDSARHGLHRETHGCWAPSELLQGKEVLLLGSGPGAREHRLALEQYITREAPVVVALNTQTAINPSMIDVRVACHPVRLLADAEVHAELPQPLITPVGALSEDVRARLDGKQLLDFGMQVVRGNFSFETTQCTQPTSLVIAYALSVATSGNASRILMAGFDGFGADDPRTAEMHSLLAMYQQHPQALPLLAVTPTRYSVPVRSIYGM